MDLKIGADAQAQDAQTKFQKAQERLESLLRDVLVHMDTVPMSLVASVLEELRDSHAQDLRERLDQYHERTQVHIWDATDQGSRFKDELMMYKLDLTRQLSDERRSVEREKQTAVDEVVARATQAREDRLREWREQKQKQEDEFNAEIVSLEKQQEELMKQLLEAQLRLREQLEEKFLPGEQAAIDMGSFMVYEIKKNGNLWNEENHLYQSHFKFAESQFLRLFGSNRFRVNQVDYVVNPDLKFRFLSKQLELKEDGRPSTPLLVFHGSGEAEMDHIVRKNFSMDKHKKNEGSYGAGIYFSEQAVTSLERNNSRGKLLLCKILVGKQFQCHRVIRGAKLTSGYDSHLSPCKTEAVMFDSDQILPCYVVHYEPIAPRAHPPAPRYPRQPHYVLERSFPANRVWLEKDCVDEFNNYQ
eukprot:TRINITY_DN15063_c0_g1_i1.p2 TRINITY_DN15063_c0_g1~~TRINITY_DN15063_c0_g1_i1.p2  ORF type:complete len:415 (-),score=96.47 TRINITY_DN15063_c0_g1_i1:32-1276(-)